MDVLKDSAWRAQESTNKPSGPTNPRFASNRNREEEYNLEILKKFSSRSGGQFGAIWNEVVPGYKETFLRWIKSLKSLQHPIISQAVMFRLEELMKTSARDEFVYRELHGLIHSVVPCKTAPDEEKGQCKDFKAQFVYKILESLNLPTFDSLLDLGCGDGRLTANIALALSVPSENVCGCDIVDFGASSCDFDFRIVDKDAIRLPFEDAKFSLVTVFMTLHHMEHPFSIIGEIFRVLKPDGLLLIREHDCRSAEFAVFLDVVHGIHTMVIPQTPKYASFRDYFARYRSRREWTRLIRALGFEEVMLPPLKRTACQNQKTQVVRTASMDTVNFDQDSESMPIVKDAAPSEVQVSPSTSKPTVPLQARSSDSQQVYMQQLQRPTRTVTDVAEERKKKNPLQSYMAVYRKKDNIRLLMTAPPPASKKRQISEVA